MSFSYEEVNYDAFSKFKEHIKVQNDLKFVKVKPLKLAPNFPFDLIGNHDVLLSNR